MHVRTVIRCVVVAALGAALVAAAPGSALAAAPALTITPNATVQPGDTIKVSGTGFGPSERVNLYFDTTLVQFVASSGTGAFGPVNLVVPSTATSTTHFVSAEGAHSGLFAQQPVTVGVDWPVQGFNAYGRANNPYENTLTSSNVGDLEVSWQLPVSDFGNYTPFVLYGGLVYAENLDGLIVAVDASSGARVWTATLGGHFPVVAPVAYNRKVYFADSNGDIVAFGARCASGGATCAPVWRHSVGGSTSLGLAVRAGAVYAASSDGTVHVLNPATGAETETPLGGTSPNGATGPITFNPDGGYAYPQGSGLYYKLPCCMGTLNYGGPVGPAAATSGSDVFATADGYLHSLGGTYWNVSVGAGGCASNVAVAGGYAFSSTCSNFGAYSLTDGSTLWQTGTYATGSAVAGRIVYACVGHTIRALYASYGGQLWAGGICSGQPIVANGTVYVAGNGELFAYRVNGQLPAAVRRPTATQLG